jgi:hypothetical protein
MPRYCLAAFLLCTTFLAHAQHSAPASPKKASAEDVCSFITGKVRAAIPQVPTMCVPKNTDLNGYELSVFSPTDVLEGKLRRAWSVALFEAMQELYFDNTLGGVCHWKIGATWLGCGFVISDSYLSQHNGRQYVVRISDEWTKSFPTDVSSEDWYQAWWLVLLNRQTFNHSGTKDNATSEAQDACKQYLAALKKDPVARQAPDMMPVPSCSVLLATDSSVYSVVDFPNFDSAVLMDYDYPLLETFGQKFSGLPYEGAIIFRSPWWTKRSNDSPIRAFRSYDLSNLTFLWDESSSGVRQDVLVDVVGSSHYGQTELHLYTKGSGGGAIVRMTSTNKDGRTLIDLTNGATWSVSNTDLAKCSPHVGDNASVLPTEKETTLAFLGTPNCSLSATFAGAW